ncbi:hypothetical protein [Ramlibacter sp.]|uniref:hypothetical protein n=1 Tax=Ramlibacter sp. TaxID=1917967 RepID=UPI0035B28FDC
MKIATLGPAGSNHDLNTRRYIDFHALHGAEVVFIDNFIEAVEMLRRGEVDLMIQVCAHHHVAETIEVHHREVFIIDCFIGRTRPMGLLTRADVETPESVGYILPTAGYFEPSRYKREVHTLSNSDTARRLLAGEFDSGFTSLDVAHDHPGRFRIDKEIGEVDVVWLVYGRTRVNTGPMIAWREAPARAVLAQLSGD